MSSDTFSRQRFRGRPADNRDDHGDRQVDPRSNISQPDQEYDDNYVEGGYLPQHVNRAASMHPSEYEDSEDSYDDDAERLYESFSDLYEDFDEGRSKAPFVIIGALLAVAIVGGGLAFAYKRGMSDGSDQPVVIRADQTATKVEPVDPGGVVIPHQDRRIYDQVTGQDTPEGETALAESNPADTDLAIPKTDTAASVDAPVADVSDPGPTSPSDSDEAPLTIGALASRVAAGDLDGLAAMPDPGPTLAVETASQQPSGQIGGNAGSTEQPRPVRTVSIGPDGSVVDSAGAIQPASSAPALAPGTPQPTTAAPSVEPAIDQGLGISAAEGLAQPPSALAGDDLQTTLFSPSPRPKPRPTTQGGAAQPVATQPTASLRPQTPVPAPSASGPELQGYAVQVASHRRQVEAVAKFADLQRRYPSLMSGYQPLIQRADLGEKGIFFRLRIGPVGSRGEANRLCESLRQAGLAGCFVRSL